MKRNETFKIESKFENRFKFTWNMSKLKKKKKKKKKKIKKKKKKKKRQTVEQSIRLFILSILELF